MCVPSSLPHTSSFLFFLFFTAPPPPAISTLSLHDALPISPRAAGSAGTTRASVSAGDTRRPFGTTRPTGAARFDDQDRKSTRLNSSHGYISYAVFCLKKKK